MSSLQTTNANIFYQTFGESGPWVTLVNGHTRSHTDFKAFAKYLTQQGYRVLIFDNRGSGQTTYEGVFEFDDLVEDVHQLWSHLKIEASHLLGISMGGMIAQLLATRYSSIVKSLVLVSTTQRGEWILSGAHAGWGNTIEEVTEKLNRYFAPPFLAKNKLLIAAMAKQILKGIESGEFSTGAADQRHAMKDLDLSVNSERIQCRALIIHGQEDRIIDSAAAGEIYQSISQSTLELIPEVGHLLLAEYAKPMYQMVDQFFRS